MGTIFSLSPASHSWNCLLIPKACSSVIGFSPSAGLVRNGLERQDALESQLSALAAERDQLKMAVDHIDAAAKSVVAALQQQVEAMTKELEGERNMHGQTRVVVEELNTICNDLRNVGQPQFIRSEAIRLLREDQAELRGRLTAALAQVETMKGDRDLLNALEASKLDLAESDGGWYVAGLPNGPTEPKPTVREALRAALTPPPVSPTAEKDL